jgi:transcription-repair coupling factor (superfamily II helicase)
LLIRPDDQWQKEFEDAFPFTETPDQQKAINQVKIDMENSEPMDRLVCGDVGFGKTEVAIRAAFKAVMDGKQVAMLAPTTILMPAAPESLSRSNVRLSGNYRNDESLPHIIPAKKNCSSNG